MLVRTRARLRSCGLRERKKEKTRLALETAALALFAEKGFDGTTVDEIAEACDVSQRTFFRYYSTKEDVLFADGDERLESVLAEIAARPAGEQPIRTVQAAFLTLVEEYAHDRERLILRSKIFDGSSGLRSHKFEQQQNWEAEITAALVARDLQATRRDADPSAPRDRRRVDGVHPCRAPGVDRGRRRARDDGHRRVRRPGRRPIRG